MRLVALFFPFLPSAKKKIMLQSIRILCFFLFQWLTKAKELVFGGCYGNARVLNGGRIGGGVLVVPSPLNITPILSHSPFFFFLPPFLLPLLNATIFTPFNPFPFLPFPSLPFFERQPSSPE